MVAMTKLYVAKHPIGVVVYTHGMEAGGAPAGGVRELVIEGERCFGLSYEELLQIANGPGLVEVDGPPELH